MIIIVEIIDRMDNFLRIIPIVSCERNSYPSYMHRVKIKCIDGVSVCLLALQEEERGKKIERVLIRILDIINQTIKRSRDFIVSIIMFDEIFDITVYNV